MGEFSKLHVRRKAQALALNVYRTAVQIRKPNTAPLRTQMIRAAMSIPTNIVEGRGQASDRDFRRFLRYSLNPSPELESHLVTARDIGAITHTDFRSLHGQLIEVRKMLYGLIRAISNTEAPRIRPRNDVPTQ